MTQSLTIGIDIGGTRTKYGLVNTATGEILHSLIKPTEKQDAKAFLNQVTQAVNEFKTIADTQSKTINGIGFGIPGFTTEEGNVLTTYSFLEFMEAYPLKKIVEEAFSLPCLLDNDARVVSLGEALYGKGRSNKRVLTLTLGTGVGFGFVVNGKFIDVLPLSHMGGNITITNEGGDCYCGKKGCLEALVSSTGIINLAKRKNFNGEASAEAIFKAATEGDSAAEKVVAQVVGYLHTAVHNYVNLFAPEVIVLGGGIAKGLSPFLKEIKGKSYMGPYPGYDFTLAVSELSESAGMLGSAALFRTLDKQQNTAYEGKK